MDPPGPVPRRVDGSTPPSFKMRRTTGETTTPDALSAEDASDATAGAGAGGVGALAVVGAAGGATTSGAGVGLFVAS
jgi:hypothetical protein